MLLKKTILGEISSMIITQTTCQIALLLAFSQVFYGCRYLLCSEILVVFSMRIRVLAWVDLQPLSL